MTTIRDHVVAMGVADAGLQDTDEYFEVVQTLVVGATGTVVKDQADLINPANNLDATDLIQIRRRVGTLGDVAYAGVVIADAPVLYVPGLVQFNGAQDKVAHVALALPNTFSLETWVRYDGRGSVGSTTYGTLFGANGTRRFMVGTGGQILAQLGGASLLTASAVVTPSVRTHLVYTYGSGVERIYANGAQVISQATASGPSFSTAFWEGSYSDPSVNYSLKGAMDNRAVYNKALLASRVLAHYQAGT